MKFEHFALNVEDPVKVAQWWAANLGLEIVFAGNDPCHGRFLRDDSVAMMVEFYRNPPSAPAPDYFKTKPLDFHVAFVSNDVSSDADRLVAAGATLESISVKPGEFPQLAMLRDPWGIPVQLAKREKPFLS